MQIEPYYPHLKRSVAILSNGWHIVSINSISEHRDSKTGQNSLKIEFMNSDGIMNLFLPICKESIFVLNRVAGIIGITAEKYRLTNLVNATMLIQIKYKRVIKIKKP